MKRDKQLFNIQRFAAAVDSGKYRTEKEITSAIRCAAGIGTAFKNLGLLYKRNSGIITRNWGNELPVASIQKEYYRLRKETIDNAKRKAVDEKVNLAPIAPTLRPDCAEKTYTKQEVIDLFKAFYIREYDRLDDRSYTLIGFLLTALDEVMP